MSSEIEMELQRAVGRIEGKLDAFMEEQKASSAAHDALTKRVTKLERVAAYGAGAIAAVAALGGYFFGGPHGR